MKYLFSCEINNVNYSIEPTEVYKDVLDIELKTATITIPHVSGDLLDLQKGDEVVITIQDTAETDIEGAYITFVQRLCVNSWSSEVESFNPLIMSYTVDLISPAMLLQCIVLPNKSFTQPLAGTTKTCKDAVDVLLTLYASNFVLDFNLGLKLATKECPELQWNRCTLFEALCDIFAVFNYVPTCTAQHIISYLDLNADNQMADETLPNDPEYYINSQDYAKNLDIEVENGICKVLTKTIKYLPLTSKEGYLNDENCLALAPFPIYSVKKLQITYNNNDTAETVGFKFSTIKYDTETQTNIVTQRVADYFDITDFIIAKTIYDTKLVINAVAPSYNALAKRFYLYFTEGKNEINGWYYNDDTWFINTASRSAIDTIIRECVKRLVELNPDWGQINDYPDAAEATQIMWYMEYWTQTNDKMLITKSTELRNNLTQIDSQQNSYVDINALALQKQDTINRMGEIKQRSKCSVPDISKLPKLGDRLGDYRVYSRSISFNANSIDVSLELSKNLIRRNQSVLLNQVKRFTQIADASSSFLRQECKVISLKFQKDTNVAADFCSYCLDSFKSFRFDSYSQYVVKVNYADGTSSPYVIMTSTNKYAGNSILSTITFMDNYAFAMQMDVDNYTLGGTPLNYIKYVDDNGEFTTIELYFFVGEYYANGDYKILPEVENFANSTYASLKTEYNILKDNREQISITNQLRFSGEDGIIIYPEFVKVLPFVNNESIITLKVGECDSANAYSIPSAFLEDDGATIDCTNCNITISNLTYSNNFAIVYYKKSGVEYVLMALDRSKFDNSNYLRINLIKED